MKVNIKIPKEKLREKLGVQDGKDGHTPTEGELKALIAPLIPEPIPGVPGSDGKTPTQSELRALIQPLIPEPKHGKDGSPDTGKEIIGKINEDNSKEKIKREKVEGLDEFDTRLKTVEVTPRGAWGGTHTIQDEGVSKTFRSNLNFVGAGVTVTDDPTNNATKVTIPGGGGGAVDSVNGQTGVVVLDTDDVSEGATNKYNATHTGDVTGATTLTLDKTAITGKTAVTGVGTDYVLISDTSDSGNLKKVLASDFMGAGSVAWGNITGTLSAQTDLQTVLDTKVDNATAIAYAVAL